MCCGRLARQKNPDLLVEASRHVITEVSDVWFVWVGDGELRNAVLARLAASGLIERWLITGWLENPLPLLKRSTVFVLPSLYESFGYATLEAMILGIPVVATDVTGTRDLVQDGITGYLVRPGDALGLAERIKYVLLNPAKARELGAAGRERAKLFSQERMASETLALYESFDAKLARGVGRSSGGRP
jgi:glycosyltransferase involved in cell wall biosynthesis